VGNDQVRVIRWESEQDPAETDLEEILSREGLPYYRWSNAPGDVYPAHAHSYHKIIHVVEGSITFGLPELEREIELQAGDRLELPAGVTHAAVVGTQGVTCLEAHRLASDRE
jgi:quercetin dioxygenase-like cupin family protein